MANKGATLTTGQYLAVGDFLVSENGIFSAYMQSDGNFCIYRGTPGAPGSYLWGSVQIGRYDPVEGQYKLYMQSDGNLCLYRTDVPSGLQFVWGSVQQGGYQPSPAAEYVATLQDAGNVTVAVQGAVSWVYDTGATDAISEVDQILAIDYDLPNAKVLASGRDELYRQVVNNKTSIEQTSSVNGSGEITETSGWEDSLQVKIGAKATFKVGIPYLGETEIEVSLDISNTYKWNGSTQTTKSWSFETPVTVPAHSHVTALVSTALSTISVPYTLTGVFTLASGTKVQGTTRGTYQGTNSHDLKIDFVEQDAGSSSPSKTTTMALSGTLVKGAQA